MSLVWNPVGLWPLVVTVFAMALAVIVLVANPRRPQNLWLAVSLLMELFLFVWGSVLIVFTASQSTALALAKASLVFAPAHLVSYLLFLSTLETPIVRPLRTTAGRTGILLMGAAYVALYFLVPGFGVERVTSSPVSTWTVVFGPRFPLTQIPVLLVFLFGFVVAVAAWLHTAPGTSARSRAKIFAWGLGIRDLGVLTLIAWTVFLAGDGAANTGQDPVPWLLFPTVVIVFVSVLSYGVLKHQLLDIDLKIKWTLTRGTAVAALAGMFFVIKESLEALMPIEGLVPTLVAAGAIGLAALPAWRLATRLVDRFMPHVEDTAEYRTVRKKEVYKAAFEEALSDGVLTQKDHNILAALADQLGLSKVDVTVVEREVAAMLRPRESPKTAGATS